MNKGATLSIGRKLLLPNPTKDPTKKPVIAATKPVTTTTTKPATTSPKPVAKATVAKKEPAKDPQTITYGDYTLSLKIGK